MVKTIMVRKMEEFRPDQKQRFTGCGRNAAGGTPTGTQAHAGAGRGRERERW